MYGSKTYGDRYALNTSCLHYEMRCYNCLIGEHRTQNVFNQYTGNKLYINHYGQPTIMAYHKRGNQWVDGYEY